MRRPFGRTLIAAGDNPAAAALSGTPLWWLKTRAFVLSSLSATVAGILLVGYAGVHPSVGARLRVRGDHRRRPRRRGPRRRARLGALGRGRRLRPRAAVHAAEHPGRPVDLAGHRPGRDHHRRRRRWPAAPGSGRRLRGRRGCPRRPPTSCPTTTATTSPPRARTQERTDAQNRQRTPSRCARPLARPDGLQHRRRPTGRREPARGLRGKAVRPSERVVRPGRLRRAEPAAHARPSRATRSSPGCSTSTAR